MNRLLLSAVLLSACSSENELVADDFADPVLELQTPGPAAWSPAGRVDVVGRVHNLQRVTVNGGPATVEGQKFTSEVVLDRGVNLVEAAGVDGHGDTRFVRHGVLAGEFADPGLAIEDAVRLRLNEGGLDVALDSVAGGITASSVQASLGAMNPVYQDSYGVWGWDAVTIQADVTDIDFSTPRLSADPRTGVLELSVSIPDLWIEILAYGEVVGFDFDTDVWMWADSADITADITLDAENGHLVADLRDATVSLNGFGYDTSLLPGDVEQYILVDTIRALIEAKLVEEIETKVPPLLEEQLAGLELSMETDMMGKPVSIEGSFAEAGIDDQGVEIDVDLDVHVPSAGDKTYAGYLAAGTGRPQTSHSADIGVSLSDDLMNRVLFEVWRAGVLDMAMSTEDGTLEPIMLVPLHATKGSIEVSAQLPPVIVEKNDGLQAQIGELDLVIRTEDGQMGSYLKASVTVFVDIEITVKNGALVLDMADPTVSIVVRESDWGTTNEATTALLEEMLPIDVFMGMLGDVEMPLPTIGTIEIDDATVSRDDTGVYTGVAVDLR